MSHCEPSSTCHPAWAIKADERGKAGGAQTPTTGAGTSAGGGVAVKKICAGAGIRSVFVTLSAHLAAAGVRTWAAFAVIRAWDGRQYQSIRDTGSPAYKFGSITADEMEGLFMTLCCVLPGLVDREVRILNAARMQQFPTPAVVEDPMPAMIVACGRLLSWYCNVQRPSMTYAMVLANREEGVAVLQCLQDTFPIRNTSLKKWVAHVLRQHSLDSEDEGSSSDEAAQALKGPWSFSKSHGMAAHVWSTPLMYGDMQNVSAQIVENMHVPLKHAAILSNGQDGWELQVMQRNMRETELALKTWTPPTDSAVTGVVSDADSVEDHRQLHNNLGAAARRGGGSQTACVSVDRTGVNATFRNGLALRYPVWKVMGDFINCSRQLEVPATRTSERAHLILQVNSFVGANSEWLALCPDLLHFPRFLAKYVCARFHASHPSLVPDPVGLMSHLEMMEMVNMVQIVSPKYNKAQQAVRVRPGTVAPFNVLAIRHQAAAGQVMPHQNAPQ